MIEPGHWRWEPPLLPHGRLVARCMEVDASTVRSSRLHRGWQDQLIEIGTRCEFRIEIEGVSAWRRAL